jgi:hypothetical protein
VTNPITIKKNQKTLERVRRSSFFGLISGREDFRIFSVKSAAGARSVPLAVDMMAERRAQKNIT